jgi:hypothetical protein
MHEYLLDFVGGNRLLAGFICLLIVLILLKYQIYLKKNITQNCGVLME